MTERTRQVDFDELMRLMTAIGFGALAMWVLASSVGVISGYVAVSPPATLRFLLAVLILVFARRTYWEVREWRWGRLPPDERFRILEPALGTRPRLGVRARRRRGWGRGRVARACGRHGTATTSVVG